MKIDHPKLHNILPAFRGPDCKKEKKYKIVTCAIRSYIGFVPSNFKGELFDANDYEKLAKVIKKLKNTKKRSHYQDHLWDAVKAIGAKELLKFARTCRPYLFIDKVLELEEIKELKKKLK